MMALATSVTIAILQPTATKKIQTVMESVMNAMYVLGAMIILITIMMESLIVNIHLPMSRLSLNGRAAKTKFTFATKKKTVMTMMTTEKP